jgi:hypothetical protein
MLFEQWHVETSQVLYSSDSKFRNLLSRDFADSGNASDGQWQQKPIDLLGLDDKEPVGLAPVRS